MYQKMGKANKSQMTPKRPTGNVPSRIAGSSNKTNHGKAQPVIKATMKGRLK